jgi:hypothetical protein
MPSLRPRHQCGCGGFANVTSSPDFEATRTVYTRVLGLEEGSFGGGSETPTQYGPGHEVIY